MAEVRGSGRWQGKAMGWCGQMWTERGMSIRRWRTHDASCTAGCSPEPLPVHEHVPLVQVHSEAERRQVLEEMRIV